MPVVTTIRLTGENHTDVNQVCDQIKSISDETGVKLRGPIHPCPPGESWCHAGRVLTEKVPRLGITGK